MVQALALLNEVAYAQRGNHPVLYRLFVQNLVVADEILVAVLLVAVDDDAEDILYSALVAVEGGASHLFPFAHLRQHPFPVYFRQRDRFGFVNGVNKPDVFLELRVRFHKRYDFSHKYKPFMKNNEQYSFFL